MKSWRWTSIISIFKLSAFLLYLTQTLAWAASHLMQSEVIVILSCWSLINALRAKWVLAITLPKLSSLAAMIIMAPLHAACGWGKWRHRPSWVTWWCTAGTLNTFVGGTDYSEWASAGGRFPSEMLVLLLMFEAQTPLRLQSSFPDPQQWSFSSTVS